jgi:hypothetical protein
MLETFDRRRIHRGSARKKLDGYGAIQARVTGFVHLAHAASSQEFQHHIWSDVLSRGKPHLGDFSGLLAAAGFEKLSGARFVGKQRSYLLCEFLILSSTLEESQPFPGIPLACGMI